MTADAAGPLGEAVCRALGLDPDRVGAITIQLEPGRAPIVLVEYLEAKLGDDGAQLVRRLESYRLEPRP